ncbi:PREDICTED: protein FAR1-RELATED SEQUENCE 5-like [Prunus mume]|uniref:Protein FAR1-RELATED SEQUENCE 5-like n=1 Tax=Prunus mume TaxID=102107 RepID=A0ABM0PJU6_PRUMU|nr:PREDICTED: protein FAR1-RELATED SEQUENCE 5-like [Prunus mume]
MEDGEGETSTGLNISKGESNEKSSQAMKGNEKIDLVHSSIRKQLIPVIGMEFETEDLAFKFYNAYAYNIGFSIRRSSFHKFKSGQLRDRLFVCFAEGKREIDKHVSNVKYHRAETRCGCLARMKISCHLNEKYRVIEFVSEHNHVTTSPSKTHFFNSHRKITLAQIAEVDMADSSGIAPKASLEFLSRQAGGRESLGFIPDDYKNYLHSKRTREMKLGDTGGVLKKNKEGRPFAMFVGVNHHKQTIIFGTALLYDETIQTFTWLFDTFVKAMSGKKPKSILTDQDAAMSAALALKWLETSHRLCIWHIYQNAAKHLSGVFEKFKDFSKDFSSCIYDYEDEDDFLNAWNNMLEKYTLVGNDWLSRLFKIREKWALVYGRQTFCADITTTQRSESMNSCIKKYVSYKYDLLRFFQHFQRLVEDRRYEELKAEFKASQSSPTLSFTVEILKHEANVYTLKVFKVFQDELCKTYDCALHFIDEMGTIGKYEVIPYGKNWQHIVTFDSTNNVTLCSCKKFEFAGILCAHALKILSTRNVKSIPAQYILKRWTKNVKAMSAKINSSSSKNDPKTFDEVDACLKEKSSQETSEVISPVINSRSELNECINIDDDIIKVRGIKIKERVVGSSKRPKNALEKLAKKRRTRKTELPNSSSVDSICVPTTKAAPAPLSEFSQELVDVNNLNMEFPVSMVNLLQAQSPLEGEFGLFSSQFTSIGTKSSSVEVDPPFSIDKSHQAS